MYIYNILIYIFGWFFQYSLNEGSITVYLSKIGSQEVEKPDHLHQSAMHLMMMITFMLLAQDLFVNSFNHERGLKCLPICTQCTYCCTVYLELCVHVDDIDFFVFCSESKIKSVSCSVSKENNLSWSIQKKTIIQLVEFCVWPYFYSSCIWL